MTTLKTKLTGCAVSLLALVSTASAATDMSNIKISGYAVASYQYEKATATPSKDSLFGGASLFALPGSPDAAKLAFTGDFAPVKAVVSLYYVPNLAPAELGILDAYVTYDAGKGYSITFGKFLSPLGFESFNAPSMYAISYGNTIGAIPGYHTGIRADYTSKDWDASLAVVDSINSKAGSFFKGDGELKNDKGIEGFVSYKGISDVVLWAGFAHQDAGGITGGPLAFTTYDFWASYQLTKEALVAAEWDYKSSTSFLSKSASAWLLFLNYAFDEKISTAFRVSGGDPLVVPGANVTAWTIAPAYKVTNHLTVRGEISYLKTSGFSDVLWGLQGVLTF